MNVYPPQKIKLITLDFFIEFIEFQVLCIMIFQLLKHLLSTYDIFVGKTFMFR